MTMNVHFVGSIGLDTTPEIFAAIGETVSKYIKRCPDGEPGGRRQWIGWQWAVLRACIGLELASTESIGHSGLCPLQIREGASEDDLRFGELGYYREALGSYVEFVEARKNGVLPASTRFQVCLPTPMAAIYSFIRSDHVLRVLPFYRDAMIQEVRRICAAIPHEDLAIQWDTCIEMIQWDGRFAWFPPFEGMKAAFERQFVAIGNVIPESVEMGIHLCYGDLDGEHFVDPVDTSKAVELANIIMDCLTRPLNWLHLPVPKAREDVAYFEPLKDLRRDPGTELFLGLIHGGDGRDSNIGRIDAARKIVSDFGIATECGIARARTPKMTRELLDLHAQAIAEVEG